ncbi:MAG: helix-hairpin-helix domain-containing protein [Phycisphaeraceae bacterium]|nr:helix-hairpin-helix domain-containing protein [Phycisphaeraceae bacterium]
MAAPRPTPADPSRPAAIAWLLGFAALMLLLAGVQWLWLADPAAHLAAADAQWRIDLNRASAADLVLLPGIGPALAERIVEDRRRQGPYVVLDDLNRVVGLGPATIQKMQPWVVLTPAGE